LGKKEVRPKAANQHNTPTNTEDLKLINKTRKEDFNQSRDIEFLFYFLLVYVSPYDDDQLYHR
jgi:hypothetical protein